LLVLWSSWSIFSESIQMLLEGIPADMDLAEVERAIREVNGV
jgi:Co/Zn/Cd efflux system component